jgi:hypothetical protein
MVRGRKGETRGDYRNSEGTPSRAKRPLALTANFCKQALIATENAEKTTSEKVTKKVNDIHA